MSQTTQHYAHLCFVFVFFKSGTNKRDFVLFWSFLLTQSCIVSVKEQFCLFIAITKVALKERSGEGQKGFLLSPLTFLAFCLPALQWEHRWALLGPARRLLHLFACGQNGPGRGLWNSLHSSHSAQVSRTGHKSAVLGGGGSKSHASGSDNMQHDKVRKRAGSPSRQSLFSTDQ